MCPNINRNDVLDQFNKIVEAFGGRPMTIEEFKNKDIRNLRSGVDDSAMQIAYSVWDKTNGSPDLSGNIVKYCKSIVFGDANNDNSINYNLKAVDILLSDKAKQVFNKGDKNSWPLDKILSELGIPKDQKQLLLELGIKDREQLALELASKYGFRVEINTAKAEPFVDRSEITTYIYNNEEYFDAGFGYFKNDNTEITKQQYEEAVKNGKRKFEEKPIQNTSYYSNLTVPGGTNYTENEISTPLITPSIKGHAQFSTDKGIGWFRGDDKAIGNIQTSFVDNFVDKHGTKWENRSGIWYSIDEYGTESKRDDLNTADMIDIHPEKEKYQIYNNTGIPTKTRRILEVQSDLFQKGRDREELIENDFVNYRIVQSPMDPRQYDMETEFELNGDKYKSTYITEFFPEENQSETYMEYFKNGDVITRSEFKNAIDIARNEPKSILDVMEMGLNLEKNQFLQLLNKDSNWVTFFIKSIIQDSIKKGYEKVLFPKGETAAKIEGHETIANEIKKVNDRINSFKKQIENKEYDFETIEEGKSSTDFFPITKEGLEKDLDRAEQEKANLKSQGIEKLKPIEGFYEIKVGNILEKQFGKDNIKIVTDEYGNQWREINLNGIDLKEIQLHIENEIPSNTNNESGVLPVKQNFDLYSNLNLLNKDGNLKAVSELEAINWANKLNIKKGYEEYRFLARRSPVVGKWSVLISYIGGQQSLFDNQIDLSSYELTKKDNDYLYELSRANVNSLKSLTKRQLRNGYIIAKELSKRTGIELEVDTIEGAYNKLSDAQKRSVSFDRFKNGGYGLYSANSIDPLRGGTATIISDRFNAGTSVHEIFGHPFLNIIKNDKSMYSLYNALAVEAMKSEGILLEAKRSYTKSLDSGLERGDQTIFIDELILRYITMYSNMKSNNEGKSIISKFFSYMVKFIKSIFGISSKIDNIRPDSLLSNFVDWIFDGSHSISLVGDGLSDTIDSAIEFLRNNLSDEDISMLNKKVLTLEDLTRLHGEIAGELISDIVATKGITSSEQLSQEVDAATISRIDSNGSVSLSSKNGGLSISYKYNISGNKLSIKDIETKNLRSFNIAILDALNYQLGDNIHIIEINGNTRLYNSLRGIISTNAMSYSDGVITINKKLRESNPVGTGMDIEDIKSFHIEFTDVTSANVSKLVSTLKEGLASQVRALERGPMNQQRIDDLNKLTKSMDEANMAMSLYNFVIFASKEIIKVTSSLDEAKNKAVKGERIDASYLNDSMRNFFSLYNTAIKSISGVLSYKDTVFSTLSEHDLSVLTKLTEDSLLNLNRVSNSIADLVKYEFSNTLNEIGTEYGSTSIGQLTSAIDNDIYIETEDISMLANILGSLAYSSKEQLQAIYVTIRGAQASANRRLENDGVLAGLFEKWAAVRSKSKFSTFNKFMEHDKNGKNTGYLISDLRYGEFNREYANFRKHITKKYGMTNYYNPPKDPSLREQYLKEKEKWLSENTERMYKPEYYKARQSLSFDSQIALEEADWEIRTFKNKFRDEDGNFRRDFMDNFSRAKLFELEKDKQSLGLFVDKNGTVKQAGTVEYRIAEEIQAFNKLVGDNIKYKQNDVLFEEEYNRILSSRGKSFADRWRADNSRIIYDEKFYDLMSKLEKSYQSPEWTELYEIRSQLIKLNRDYRTMDVLSDRIENNKVLASKIRSIDKWLDENRTESPRKASDVRFEDIAEIVPTAAYNRAKSAAISAGNDAYKKWYSESHYVDSNGYLKRYSHFNKLEPKDKSLIKVVPGIEWNEIDENSNWYNNNFDKSKEEHGYQPIRSKYDNSKEYNKLMSKIENAEFRNALLDAYTKANENYAYIKRPSNLRLAQIPGGFWHTMFHGDKMFSGIVQAFKNKFKYIPSDMGIGDTETSGMYYADGTPIMVIPTRFRTMLEEPNTISRDLLYNFAMYYKSALNFSELSKVQDKTELLLEGIRNTVIQDKRTKKRAGESRMYDKARSFVAQEMYGNDLSSLYEMDLGIFSGVRDWLLKTFKKASNNRLGSITLRKSMFGFIDFIRKVNLSFNVRAITGNFAGAVINSKIEANTGTWYNMKEFNEAHAEIIKHLPNALYSIENRSNDKIITLMRYLGMGRSNEKDMKGLHGIKMANAIREHIWYGPYSAGDFIVKAPAMVATLKNYKLYNGEFIQKERFLVKYFPSDRENGLNIFNSIKDNLYGAFDIDKSLNKLIIKDEYKDSVTENLLNSVSLLLGNISRRLDGTMTNMEKTRMHNDAFASLLLLHRNWLLVAIQERIHGKFYSYEKQMDVDGLINLTNVFAPFYIIPQMYASKIYGIISKVTPGLEYNGDITKHSSKYDEKRLYAAKRLYYEMMYFIGLSILSVLSIKAIDEDDKDKLMSSLEMWIHTLLLRITIEVGSPTSPIEILGLQKSPTAAQGFIQQITDLLDGVTDGTLMHEVRSGEFKGKTKLERITTRLTPGYKNIHKDWIAPDLRTTDRFQTGNVGVTYNLVEKILWPESPRLNKDKKDDSIQDGGMNAPM